MSRENAQSTLTAKVGQTVGSSDWFQMDQSRINAFADVTLDHQFIHLDPAKAAQTPFGGTVAHGFLTLSLLTHLLETTLEPVPGTVAMLNYGFDRLRFLQPVSHDARIRAKITLADLQERGPLGLVVSYDIDVEIEHGQKPAIAARWLTLHQFAK